MKIKISLLFGLLFIAVLLSACKKSDYRASIDDVRLVRVDPSEAHAGDIVKLYGWNFSEERGGNTVMVGDKVATVLDCNRWDMNIVLPALIPGEYEIRVANSSGVGSGLKIRLIANKDMTYILRTFAGNSHSGSEDGLGTDAVIGAPEGICWTKDGSMLITQRQSGFFRVRGLNQSASVSTISSSAALNYPWQGNCDAQGNYYLANKAANNILKMASDGSMETVSIGATLKSPMEVAFAPDGAMLIANRDANQILKVDADGSVLNSYTVPKVSCLTTDAAGNIYAGSESTGYLYKISASDGSVTQIAGKGKQAAPYSDGEAGKPETANIGMVGGIYLGKDDVLYFTDKDARSVRKLKPAIGNNYAKGTVVTMVEGFYPNDLVVTDDCSTIYVTSSSSHTVRIIEMY